MRLELAKAADDRHAPVIYVVNSPQHPLDLASAARGLASSVVSVYVDSWGDELTPWPAPALRKEDPPFGGNAQRTLSDLVAIMEDFERGLGHGVRARGIAGYSLGGLFALYAWLQDPRFLAVASMSGSLWYDGFFEHALAAEVDAAHRRFAYLSLGSKEKRAAQARVKLVEKHTRRLVDGLADKGVTCEFSLVPGSHFAHLDERLARGLSAIDQALGAQL